MKVSRYVFSMNPSQFAVENRLLAGKGNGFVAYGRPRLPFRPQVLHVNVDEPGLVYINTIQINGKDYQIGAVADAFHFSKNREGACLRIEFADEFTQEVIQVTGTWSTKIPRGLAKDDPYTLCFDFEGDESEGPICPHCHKSLVTDETQPPRLPVPGV